MFVGGFLFDFLTMQRIDAWLDLAFQLAYLLGLTVLLILHDRPWRYHTPVLHFLYGGLLSAYVVLYFRSSTFARPLIFLVLLVAVMFINEVPAVRRAGHRLRLGVYALCVLSFLTYFVPIVVGRIGGWIFLLSLISSAVLVWIVTRRLVAPEEPDRRSARMRLFAPGAGVLIAIAVLYVLRLIPPVPLSVQFQGIYHEVRRDATGYTLVYEQPPVWAPWRRDSRPFERRMGDRVHYFARVFAPTSFEHGVVIRWEVYDERREVWLTTDRIPLDIVGGRAEGFRGFAVKSNIGPGRWRVTAETDDGRAIATSSFRVEEDERSDERRWRSARA
ncbi:MAG: DUF2914 domain-containing protein [Acidimicrobiia bacterium]|nr:DUF2914 domain-containing protein [Acidimicrobiia bacterium]